MFDTPFGRDIAILGLAITFAVCAASVTARMASPTSPVWPVRIWLWLFRNHALTYLKRYPETRSTFSRREQFLASFFAWFFIVFVVGVMVFGCGYRTGCQ